MNREDVPPAAHGVRLVVAYDGSRFHGFQRQPGLRTVQGALERAAEPMTGRPPLVYGASRTDAGVHALHQVVAFGSDRPITARGWMLGMNTRLPDDIRVQSAAPCAPDYNPRFDSSSKRYRYLLELGEVKNPLLRHRTWQLGHRRVDVEAMAAAGKLLEGTHDFAAFRSADDTRESTVRTLFSVGVVSGFSGDPSLLSIEVHGNAFMKNMVRILAGTLVAVGRGRLKPHDMPRLLESGALRAHAGETAPAHGLTLVHVELGRSGIPVNTEDVYPSSLGAASWLTPR